MQTIRALIALSILVPALAFAAAAWLSRRQVIDEAHQRVQTTVGLLREHALKVFDTHVLALKQIDDRTKDLDWETIGRSESLHRYLAGLSRDLGTPNGLWLTDARGRIRAASMSFPAPEIDVSDREYFVAQRDRDAGAFVSVPYERRAGDKNWAFAISRRRSTPDGNFDGIVHVAIDTKYFTSFWEEVSQHSGHLIPLMREDGEMLVRYPAMIGQRLRLAPDAPFRQAIARTPNGIYTAVSRVDGIERINGYQKIGAYPLYISYSLETQAVLAPWYRNLLLYGGVALIASAALATLGWQALRRAGQEQRMFERWQSEQVRREEVETALHHAQKMEALGHLTGGIAHDFNNLLTVVLGNLEAIGRRTEAGDEPLRRSIRNAQKGAERAAALTQQLLAFARQQPLQPIDLDVNDLVQRILELLGRTLGEHISLRADLAPDLWPVRVDPNQLESALLNLAVNARDAMPESGVLTIRTRNIAAEEAARLTETSAGQECVLLEVADTGLGMSEDIKARAFEPFFTAKPVGQGSGLGLSQVHGFVTQSGGQVAIDSALGQGTTVRLYLPRAT